MGAVRIKVEHLVLRGVEIAPEIQGMGLGGIYCGSGRVATHLPPPPSVPRGDGYRLRSSAATRVPPQGGTGAVWLGGSAGYSSGDSA